ncbi:MAG: patatin-like phospholipase family protein [Verrucomicrobiota bacterium]
MNRLLSLDGGGIRALFTLEILDRVEAILRKQTNNDKLVLADYFNFIGGNSTGAIVSACLSWGMEVSEVRDFYLKFADEIFRPVRSWRFLRHAYDRENLAQLLQQVFVEEDGSEALLGSPRLRTLLMVVLRNGSSGSVWPITNSPGARYNARNHDSCNLNYPLWKLIRASTAAPTFFPTETISVKRRGKEETLNEFVDGGVTPYNNPALRMFVQATVPELGIGMATGVDKTFVLSVGTGRVRKSYGYGRLGDVNRIGALIRSIHALIDSSEVEQDVMCRVFGKCVYGESVDREIGALMDPDGDGSDKHFTYCRYNHTFTEEEQKDPNCLSWSGSAFDIDNLKSMELLTRIGRRYAAEHVDPSHFPEMTPGLGSQILKPNGDIGHPSPYSVS